MNLQRLLLFSLFCFLLLLNPFSKAFGEDIAAALFKILFEVSSKVSSEASSEASSEVLLEGASEGSSELIEFSLEAPVHTQVRVYHPYRVGATEREEEEEDFTEEDLEEDLEKGFDPSSFQACGPLPEIVLATKKQQRERRDHIRFNFIQDNLLVLEVDMARGYGDSFDTLAALYFCQGDDIFKFQNSIQNQYEEIFEQTQPINAIRIRDEINWFLEINYCNMPTCKL